MHKSIGSNAEWLGPEEIKRRWPLYNMEGIAAGTFGPTDGHVDAYGLLMAYKSKARFMGAEYIEDEVTTFLTLEGSPSHRRPGSHRAGAFRGRHRGELRPSHGRRSTHKSAGVDIPVVPVRRQILAVDTRINPDPPLPLTFHP